MKRSIRLTILALGAATLCACSSVPYLGDNVSAGGGYAAGSALEHQFSGADETALAAAFEAAMASGTTQGWSGKRAVGEVRPGRFALANLKASPNETAPAARGDFDLSPAVEIEQGLYVLTRNANVRTGPGTEYPVAVQLKSGDGIEVVGAVVDKDWMLAAKDGVIEGYIYKRLMIKAPGTELELAGGPRRQAELCREFSQTASIYSQTDRWDGVACRSSSGWRVLRPEPADDANAPVYLTD